MQDAPELNSSIENMDKPQHDNMISLAENYHNIVCKDHSCIIYEKPIPLFQFALEPVIGVAKYKNIVNYSPEFGSYFFVWVPQTNENLFLKTGFIIQKIDEGNEQVEIIKIPLQIQYLFNGSKFQPKFSGGFNFLKLNYSNYENQLAHTFCLNTGFISKLSKNISFSTNLNFDIVPIGMTFMNNYYGISLISYSINLGVYIKL